MLEPLPSRSVTRFLLPLADVMTLLFAIFLLLPHLEHQPGVDAETATRPGELWSATEQRQVREELARLRRLAEVPASQRLQLVVLRFDSATGNLMVRDAEREVPLTGDEQMDRLVQRDIENSRTLGKELHYVIHAPSELPNLRHLNNYRRWFGKWGVSYEIPIAKRAP